ncbi:hypothetical protein KY316_02670, partial [Candidatus Woesearchaeota archaeon]|nr:hypothetical protein [Candidatus Woesearchaeota archaeon]
MPYRTEKFTDYPLLELTTTSTLGHELDEPDKVEALAAEELVIDISKVQSISSRIMAYLSTRMLKAENRIANVVDTTGRLKDLLKGLQKDHIKVFSSLAEYESSLENRPYKLIPREGYSILQLGTGSHFCDIDLPLPGDVRALTIEDIVIDIT